MTNLLSKSEIAAHWLANGESDNTSAVIDPASGQTIAAYRNADAAEVDEIVSAAANAFQTWGRTTPAERADRLLHLADALDGATDEMARIESQNVGRPLSFVGEEIAYDSDVLRFMAGAARISHVGAAGEYVAGSTSMTRRDPVGVVGLITPWNYPLMELVWKIAPAIAAGNTVVVKPSELTPQSTLKFAELARGILPDGVLNVALGDSTTGRAIVEHPAVRLVSLTGDVSTGKKVAASAAQTLKRVHLELGGNAPALVFADVPIRATANQLASTAFLNSGQDCTAPCRVVVANEVYDEFVEAYKYEVAALIQGDPSDASTYIGPVISEAHLDRVSGFVDRARDAGAVVLAGGRRVDRKGWFYEPTVLTDVAQGAEIIQKEVFGPVVTIQRAASDDEMLDMANGVDHGLAASVWTSDVSRGLRFTRELAFGTVWLNQHLVLANEMPFGGFGQSGYGKELSAHAIDEYSQIKHVMLKGTSE